MARNMTIEDEPVEADFDSSPTTIVPIWRRQQIGSVDINPHGAQNITVLALSVISNFVTSENMAGSKVKSFEPITDAFEFEAPYGHMVRVQLGEACE